MLLEQHGEEITYYSVGQAEGVAIKAIVNATQRQKENQTIQYDSERVALTILKDSDNAVYGGVEAPKVGDAFTREGDSSNRSFAFTGEVLDSSTQHWELEFVRDTPRRVGTGHRARSR